MNNSIRPAFFDKCPGCDAVLTEEWTERDGSAVKGSKVIGVELPGVYDGVAYWQCPSCDVVWHRWAATSPGNESLRRVIEISWRENGLTSWSASV